MRLVTIVAGIAFMTSVLAPAFAGSLDPPGAPAPSMKTLDLVEPRIPISALPYTINAPGSYYLTGNLSVPSIGDGITVNATSATIDLNGYTMDGGGSAKGQYAIRIETPGTALGSFTVRNGTITNWNYGIWQGLSGPNLFLEALTIRSTGHWGVNAYDMTVLHCNVNFNSLTGILSRGVLIVRDSRVAGNGDGGIRAEGPRNLIEDNVVDSNTFYGVYAGPGSIVRHNVVTNTLPAATGGGDGIQMSSQVYVAENNVYGNFLSGIRTMVLGAGRIESNNSVGNGRYGIESTAGSMVIVKNTTNGNTLGGFQITGSGNIAPIDAVGTSTNPWVNFSN